MALESLKSNGSFEKSEGERVAIAKEVIIKTLLPVVFGNISEGEREQEFDRWYGKLLNLITGIEEDTQLVKVVDAPPHETPGASKKVVETPKETQEEALKRVVEQSKKSPQESPVENKATDKQIKKIFAQGHQLNMGKEELEEEAFKVSGVDRLSNLSKSQASDLIDSLTAMEGIKDIYG